MSDSPAISVLVLNYNTPTLTQKLIDSLADHTTGLILEVIVVDNGSRAAERFWPIPGQLTPRVWHLNHNLGFGAAANLAAQQARAPYVLLANSDCLVRDGVVRELLTFLENHPEAGACAPRLLFPDGQTHASARRLPTFANVSASRRSLWRHRSETYTLEPSGERIEVPAVSATFLLMHTELFRQLGGFDRKFFMYVEDTDLCHRLSAAGKTIYYLGDQTVIHHWGASSRKQLWRLALEHHRSIRYYFRKHHSHRRRASWFFACKLAANLIVTLALIIGLRYQK
jgi:GT2 family glycosyltransferase